MRQVGAFGHRSVKVFQMGIIFNFDNGEKLQPGTEVAVGSLDFIADRFVDLHLQKPEPFAHEDKSPSICIFLVGLEDAVEACTRVGYSPGHLLWRRLP